MEAWPILDLELGLVIEQRAEGLQDQNLEHHDMVMGWALALGAIGSQLRLL